MPNETESYGSRFLFSPSRSEYIEREGRRALSEARKYSWGAPAARQISDRRRAMLYFVRFLRSL